MTVDAIPFSDNTRALKTRQQIVQGWRDDSKLRKTLDEALEKVKSVIDKEQPDAKLHIAGGAVRNLVYDTLAEEEFPSDIDFYVSGLVGTELEKQHCFEAIRDVLLLDGRGKAQWGRYPGDSTDVDPDPTDLDKDKDRQFLQLRYYPPGWDDNSFSIDFVEGQDTIEESVAWFDWYESCWYLPSIDSKTANRPELDFVAEKSDISRPHAESGVLTLINYHHAAKTLMRGFKMMRRHGFKMSITDAQVLATECRLMGEKYGQYLYVG